MSRKVFVVLMIISSKIICSSGISQVESIFFESDEGLKCKLCPVGKYLKRPCEKNFGPSVCKTCPVGTFSSRPSQAKSCKDCSHCPVSQVVTKACRKTRDTRCACPFGTYYDPQTGGLCLKDTLSSGKYKALNGLWCQLCPAGSYVLSQCEKNYGSSRCSVCSLGTFSSRPNYATRCEECSDCPIGQIENLSCSAIRDTQCKCPNGQFWQTQAVEQGICTPHTVCKPEERILKPGTSTTDTVCEVKHTKVKEKTNKNIVLGSTDENFQRQTIFMSISRKSEAHEKPLLSDFEVKSDDLASNNNINKNFNSSKTEQKPTSMPIEVRETDVSEFSTQVYTTTYSILSNDISNTSVLANSNKHTFNSKLEYVSNKDEKWARTKLNVEKTSSTTKRKGRNRRRKKKGKALSRKIKKKKDRKRKKNKAKKNRKKKRKKRCREKEKGKKRCRRRKKKRHRHHINVTQLSPTNVTDI